MWVQLMVSHLSMRTLCTAAGVQSKAGNGSHRPDPVPLHRMLLRRFFSFRYLFGKVLNSFLCSVYDTTANRNESTVPVKEANGQCTELPTRTRAGVSVPGDKRPSSSC